MDAWCCLLVLLPVFAIEPSQRTQLGDVAIGADGRSFQLGPQASGAASLSERSSSVDYMATDEGISSSASAKDAASSATMTMIRREAPTRTARGAHIPPIGSKKEMSGKLESHAKSQGWTKASCSEHLEDWKKAWSQWKKDFCCHELDIACESEEKQQEILEEEDRQAEAEDEALDREYEAAQAASTSAAPVEEEVSAPISEEAGAAGGESTSATTTEPVVKASHTTAKHAEHKSKEGTGKGEEGAAKTKTAANAVDEDGQPLSPALEKELEKVKAQDEVAATEGEILRLEAKAHVSDDSKVEDFKEKAKEGPNDIDIDTEEEQLALIGFAALGVIICSAGVYMHKQRQEDYWQQVFEEGKAAAEAAPDKGLLPK